MTHLKNSKIIRETRKLIPGDIGIIAKIENKSAIKNEVVDNKTPKAVQKAQKTAVVEKIPTPKVEKKEEKVVVK